MKGFDYAIKLLSGRNYFSGELETAVSKKFPEEDAAEIVARLIEYGYVNDEKLLRDFIRWKSEDGHGEYYIREKLYQKGINRDIREIRAIIEDADIDIAAQIVSLIKKYRKLRSRLDSSAFRQACIRYLTGRGYAVEDCIKILSKEVIEDESDLFEGC